MLLRICIPGSGSGTTLLLILLLITLCISCNKDSPTQPPEEPPAGQAILLLSRLSVAVVPGGSESIVITAVDRNNMREPCSITCDRPDIVSLGHSDSILTLTGITHGSANVTVTSRSNLQRVLPVQVYNHKVLDTGELLVAFVDEFQYRWHDGGSGQPIDGAYYHPVTTDGFRALGSLGQSGYTSPNGRKAVMVVKAREGSNALAEPLDYTLVWSDQGSGASNDGSFWTPVPPEGYVAMGTVARAGYTKPPLSDVVCVRADLTVPGETGAFIWRCYIPFPPILRFKSWMIDPPNAGPHDNAYLATGTFVAVGSNSGSVSEDPPGVHPVMNVLKVTLPLLSQAPYQTIVPTLSGYGAPPEETFPTFARAMLMPCTTVKDSIYSGDPNWRIRNSPFYRLERQVYYKLLYHNHNQTSQTQTNSVLIRSGVTTTESQTYWNSTAISISFEAGISIKMFSSKVTATVTRSFGYEQQTSVAVLQEREVSSSINTPPGKAAALWQQYNRYVLMRHNGTQLEPVASWAFGIDSYVTDEYPD